MKINKSPWIYQLDSTRPTEKLKQDIETDVAIIGAGIAGIATAFSSSSIPTRTSLLSRNSVSLAALPDIMPDRSSVILSAHSMNLSKSLASKGPVKARKR